MSELLDDLNNGFVDLKYCAVKKINYELVEEEVLLFFDSYMELRKELWKTDFEEAESIEDICNIINPISECYGFKTSYDGENIDLCYTGSDIALFKGIGKLDLIEIETGYIQPFHIDNKTYNNAKRIIIPYFKIQIVLNNAKLSFIKSNIRKIIYQVNLSRIYGLYIKTFYDYLSRENDMMENKVGSWYELRNLIRLGRIPSYKENKKIMRQCIGTYYIGTGNINKICIHCGKKFITEYPSKKYCSEQCKKEATKIRKASK